MSDGFRLTSPTLRDHPLFFLLGCATNILIVSFVLLSLYGVFWEFSTREYLRGFSDAIVPFAAPPEQQVQAILTWMDRGPARNQFGASGDFSGRDPVNTLNYAGLLRACGTATNAFVNLADAGGLEARRLLLLGPSGNTNHVVAEVHIDGRWIVVDPSYRVIPRDVFGRLLTKEQLAEPNTFRLATSAMAHYDPRYAYTHTEHIHLTGVPIVGAALRRVLNSLFPEWDESMRWTLLVERRSYAVLVMGPLLLVLSLLWRHALDVYGRKFLGVSPVRLRVQLKQGSLALLGRPDRAATVAE
jgi:hypothetical protein